MRPDIRRALGASSVNALKRVKLFGCGWTARMSPALSLPHIIAARDGMMGQKSLSDYFPFFGAFSGVLVRFLNFSLTAINRQNRLIFSVLERGGGGNRTLA